MKRTILTYGLLIALVAVVLQWAEWRYLIRAMPGESYIGLLALVFIAIGIWVGLMLTPRRPVDAVRNDRAIASLGITPREYEVLCCLAKGDSNKEIARALSVSPNTVKTHVSSLYTKLDATGRGKAVEAARALSLL